MYIWLKPTEKPLTLFPEWGKFVLTNNVEENRTVDESLVNAFRFFTKK